MKTKTVAHCRYTSLLAVLFCSVASPARALEPQREGDRYRFGDARFSIALDARSGAFVELKADGQVWARDEVTTVPFDLRQDAVWVVAQGKTNFTLQGVQATDANTVVATLRGGDWQVRCGYHLEPERKLLSRSAEVTWQGKEGTKLKGFSFRSPRVSVEKDGSYFLPGNYPPEKYDATSFQAGRRGRHGLSNASIRAAGAAPLRHRRRAATTWAVDGLAGQ